MYIINGMFTVVTIFNTIGRCSDHFTKFLG